MIYFNKSVIVKCFLSLMWITSRILGRENELLFGIISELTDNIRFQAYFNKPEQEL